MPIGLGGGNPFPLQLGGGDSALDIEQAALLHAMLPSFSDDDDTANAAEAYAEAFAIAQVWACDARLANQGQPLKMLEALTDWEEAAGLRPTRRDLDVTRRARLAARLRGIPANSISDITDACSALLGTAFGGVNLSTDDFTYWPGINPGPPGLEWSSTRAKIFVTVLRGGLSLGDFRLLTESLVQMLDDMCPSWMTFAWNTGSGFLVGSSKIGSDGL